MEKIESGTKQMPIATMGAGAKSSTKKPSVKTSRKKPTVTMGVGARWKQLILRKGKRTT